MAKAEKKRGRLKQAFARLNRTFTEVGIEHFDDDRDWDDRVKLPEWQLARLKARYEAEKARKPGRRDAANEEGGR